MPDAVDYLRGLVVNGKLSRDQLLAAFGGNRARLSEVMAKRRGLALDHIRRFRFDIGLDADMPYYLYRNATGTNIVASGFTPNFLPIGYELVPIGSEISISMGEQNQLYSNVYVRDLEAEIVILRQVMHDIFTFLGIAPGEKPSNFDMTAALEKAKAIITKRGGTSSEREK